MAQVITYNLTIDDTSPQIAYSPATLVNNASPDLQSSWNQYFSGVGFNAFPGQTGSNDASLHVTQKDGANFSISFTGTAIRLYGLAVQSAFSIELDSENAPASSFAASRALNTTADPASALLASFSGLPQQNHIITFTTHTANAENASDSSGFIIFDRAVVTVSTGRSDASLATTLISDTELQFTGSWTFVNDSTLIPEGDHSCHITQAAGDQAQYSFKGSSIELGGLTNASAGSFNISLTSDSDSVSIQQHLSGLSSFLTYTTLFYASALDPDTTHTLTITNTENKTLALEGMNITVVTGGESVSSPTAPTQVTAFAGLSRGAIAGIAAASSLALLFLLSILALAICYWRRRKHRRRRREAEYPSGIRPQPLHRRVESGEVVPISPRFPSHGESAPQIALVETHSPTSAREIMESIHPDKDVETDSGLGHMREKRASENSIPSFDNIPRERGPPTRQPARHRSLPLSRWSGWFTSSSRANSPSPRRNAPSSPTVPIVSPRPVRGFAPPGVLSRAHVRDSQTSSDAREAALLEVPRTSPFEVDFEKHGQLRPPMPSDLPRTVNSGSLGSQAKDILVSFLDFASSGAASLRESTRSRSRRHSLSNKSTNQSVAETQLHSRTPQTSPQESSGQSQSASTGMWTLSLSVEPPRRPVRESQELVPRTAVETMVSTRHPFSMVSADLQVAAPDSPTESLPMSVSDINFRNDEENESPTVDRIPRFHLPRHPPLPGTPHSYSFTPNVQISEFARASHMRQMSAPNLGAAEPRRPYVAQTSFGRRLAQVRAQAMESQASLTLPPSQSSTPGASEQPVTQPSSSRLRTLPLPFIHSRRSASGS